MDFFKSSPPGIIKLYKPAVSAKREEIQYKKPTLSVANVSNLPHISKKSISYSLEPREVKKVMDAKYNDQPYDEQQFLYYHLHRNYFNTKNVVKTLTQMDGHDYKYTDNLGNIWDELYQFQNLFHMPTSEWVTSILPFTEPYSRKFVREDNISGVGGEFEMVIRRDGKRIDAHTSPVHQESYNYGRTRLFHPKRHKVLDMDPHGANSNYVSYGTMGYVKIQESEKNKERQAQAAKTMLFYTP